MCYSLARRAAPVSLAAPAPPLTQCRRRGVETQRSAVCVSLLSVPVEDGGGGERAAEKKQKKQQQNTCIVFRPLFSRLYFVSLKRSIFLRSVCLVCVCVCVCLCGSVFTHLAAEGVVPQCRGRFLRPSSPSSSFFSPSSPFPRSSPERPRGCAAPAALSCTVAPACPGGCPCCAPKSDFGCRTLPPLPFATTTLPRALPHSHTLSLLPRDRRWTRCRRRPTARLSASSRTCRSWMRSRCAAVCGRGLRGSSCGRGRRTRSLHCCRFFLLLACSPAAHGQQQH